MADDDFLSAAKKAVAAVPDTRASASAFAHELSERCGGDATKLEKVVVADLFVAWASLEQDPAALRELERRLKASTARIRSGSIEDTLQIARQRLLVGEGKRPRLQGYSGQGPLVKWLRTVLLSITIDTRRRERPERYTGDHQLLEKASSEAGPDVRMISAKHRGEFTKAFAEALAELSAQERTVLRMRFVDQLNIEDIGNAFGVHRTTAMRWMDAAFQKVLEGTRSRLGERLKIPRAELNSLWRAFQPSLAERLSRLLPKQG